MADLVGYAQLQARLHAMQRATPQLMNTVGLAVVRQAKLNTKPNRKTGNLERSIAVVSHTATSVTVAAKAHYAPYVEHGTRGGTVITPKAARVLAWGGARRLTGSLRSGAKPTHFAMRVVRGATRPFPFLIPAARTVAAKIGLGPIVDAWNGAA